MKFSPIVRPGSGSGADPGDVMLLDGSNPMEADLNAGTHKIINLVDPTAAQHAATRAYVLDRINALIAAAPGALDTLDELAAALGDDPNFATTIINALAGKQPSDTDLTAIAALASAADKGLHATGAGAWALHDLTAYGRTLNALTDAAGLRAALDGPVGTFAQIVHRKNDGNITITPAAANTWYDVDPTGSAAARDLDIVFADVEAGQKVDMQMIAQMTNVVNAFQFDYWSIVGGNPVNHISMTAFGLLFWTIAASAVTPFGGPMYPFTIQAGDIDNGDLRMRLRYRAGTTTARDINCNAAAGTELVLVGRGPFG